MFYKRNITHEIESYLNDKGAIVLHGARQVGKTSLLYILKNNLDALGEKTHYIDLEDSRMVQTLDQGVDVFIAQLEELGVVSSKKQSEETPASKAYIFIDEIQYLTNPSSFIKLIVDHYPYIKLIVSGSSSFDIKSKFSDSLVGRIVDFEIFPLSFEEFLRFKEIPISLQKKVRSPSTIDSLIRYYEEYVLFGGYPQIVLATTIEKKEKYLQQILDTYVRRDIRDLANIRDIQKFNLLLKALATQSGQLMNYAALGRMVSLSITTLEHYLSILEATYILKRVYPYSNNPRVEVSKMPKIFFYDTGLQQMLWFSTLNKTILGNVLETSIFGELVKKYSATSIRYWRNRSQNEIDFILLHKGNILPLEVKQNFTTGNRKILLAFCAKYALTDWKVVGLLGKKPEHNSLYPWEL
jgi:predicted AAA+ superfamily ATPase